MDKMEWIAPCHFGLESVLKREIQDLGYEIVQVEDGRVTFSGGMEAACRANIFLRTAERILLKAGVSERRRMMSCLRKQKKFRGKITYPRTESSGWRKPHR